MRKVIIGLSSLGFLVEVWLVGQLLPDSGMIISEVDSPQETKFATETRKSSIT